MFCRWLVADIRVVSVVRLLLAPRGGSQWLQPDSSKQNWRGSQLGKVPWSAISLDGDPYCAKIAGGKKLQAPLFCQACLDCEFYRFPRLGQD